jgi:hypothetical protein
MLCLSNLLHIRVFDETLRFGDLSIEKFDAYDEVFYPCPVCNDNILLVRFWEDKVTNCDDEPIDPTQLLICTSCTHIIQNYGKLAELL